MGKQVRTKYQFYQEASLSQKLANEYKEFTEYAGAAPEISKQIALLNVLGENDMIDLNEPVWKFVKDYLNEQRKAMFATSERTNEISKMGMMLPKAEMIVAKYDED